MTPAEEAWERLNSRLEAVETQRNEALTKQAVTFGELAIANKKLDEAKAEIARQNKAIDDMNIKLTALVSPKEA